MAISSKLKMFLAQNPYGKTIRSVDETEQEDQYKSKNLELETCNLRTNLCTDYLLEKQTDIC